MIGAVLLTGSLLLAACTGPSHSAPDVDRGLGASMPTLSAAPPAWPGGEWELARPDGERWADLDAAAAGAASACVAVVHDGELVHRWTAAGATERTPVKTYSVTKSITALVVGIAMKDGLLTVDDKVSGSVPHWADGPSSEVTIGQLLSNTSGRQWSYDVDYRQMIRAADDKTAFAVALGQQHEPGTHWEYNNAAVQVLEAVLTEVLDRDVAEFADERLFAPLGLRDTTWEHDAAGNTTLYSGISSTCDDLARIGLLVARDGRWRDEQIVPAPAIRRLTAMESSTMNSAYAGLWWVNRPGRVQTVDRAAGFGADRPAYTGQLAPDAPADARWALGYGNQLLAVVPSRKLVAVRLGSSTSSRDVLGPADLTRRALDGL